MIRLSLFHREMAHNVSIISIGRLFGFLIIRCCEPILLHWRLKLIDASLRIYLVLHKTLRIHPLLLSINRHRTGFILQI